MFTFFKAQQHSYNIQTFIKQAQHEQLQNNNAI